MSLDDLKRDLIKTFETENSYIHRDDLDGLINIIKTLTETQQDLLNRIAVLEAK